MRSWRIWLGFLISIVFLYLALRGQDFELIWDSLRSAEYIWLAPALVAYFLGVAVRAIRWDFLLRPLVRLSPAQVFPVVVIGYMANNVLPLRAGELVRSYALSSRYHVRKSGALGTIAVERIFDGFTMVVFILIASLSIALTSDLRNVYHFAAILFAVLALVLLMLVFAPTTRDRVIARVMGLLPDKISERLHPMVEAFIAGLGIFRRWQDLLSVVLTSLLAWLLEASTYLFIAEAFNLDLSPAAILLITAVANLATLVPSSPGYVGAFEYGVILVMTSALGISREVALSYAVVVHAALYFPVTILGFIFWWRESLSWREMRSTEEATS